MSAAPVLILGTGRCGSTLLSRLARSHPTMLSISELFSFVSDLGMRIDRAFPAQPIHGEAFWKILAEPQPRQSMLLRHGLQMDEVIYPWECGRFTAEQGVPPILQVLLPHLRPLAPDTLFDQLQDVIPQWPAAPVANHYRALFEWLQQVLAKQSWVERSGGSLRIAQRLLQAFPEAKVLHLVRDGRNTALSMSQHIGFRMALLCGQQSEFLGVDPFESDNRSEEEDLTEELAALLPERFSREAFQRFDLPAALCGHHWSGEIVTGLQVLHALPAEQLLTLRYEDLLAHPLATIERIDAFFDGSEHPEWAHWAVSQIGQGRSAWQALPERDRAELDEVCRPGFDALAELGLTWN